MKTKLFKPLFLFVCTIFLLSASRAGNIDFSGHWTLNENKSDMGQFANIVPPKIEASQREDSLSITRNNKTFDGSSEYTVSETLSYDGKEKETVTPPGNSKRKASAKWSDDGKTFTITYTLTLDFGGDPMEVKGTEVWTLGDDKKTLNVTNSSSSSFGENVYKAVYQKS